MSTGATQVHGDGRVTGTVEVQDGRGRPLVIEFEAVVHDQPMSRDALSAWDRLLWGNPMERIAEARAMAGSRRAAGAA
jgi:hypothetical protein